MSPLSWVRLTITAALMAVVAFVVSRILLGAGHTPMTVPWTALVVSVAVAGIVVWLGWTVRQYRRGDNPGLSGLRAMRIAVIAQAAAYTGALLAGGYGGYGVAVALEWAHAPRREVALSALLGLLGAAVLAVAGKLAERWCKLDGDDRDDPPAEGATA